MNGLSRQAMFKVEWYLARMGEDQLQQTIYRANKKLTEKRIKRTQTGFEKFEEFEVKNGNDKRTN